MLNQEWIYQSDNKYNYNNNKKDDDKNDNKNNNKYDNTIEKNEKSVKNDDINNNNITIKSELYNLYITVKNLIFLDLKLAVIWIIYCIIVIKILK